MLSIGIYTYSTRPRGSVVHAVSLGDALSRAGHDVTLYALSKAGDSLFRETRCKLELFPAEPAPQDSAELIRQRIDEFLHGIARHKPRHAIHHAEDCLAANALLLARPALSGALVRTVHHVERFESPYLVACQRRSIEQMDALFSVSALTQREVREGFARESRLVQNGVDPARLRALAQQPNGILEKLEILAKDRLVLSVGGIEPRKNSLRALDAIAHVFEREPRLRWVIAGGASIFDHADYRATFEARLASLPAALRARVLVTGVLSEVELAALYARSEVLLCPSEQEGFALCVLEAMASESAVVASNRPPFTEYLDPDCACLVDPESTSSIAEGLERALDDSARAHALSARGRARAERFSWDESASQHLRHYDALFSKCREHE